MNDLNRRIGEIISSLGIKKAVFAERLNVSQAFVSQMCSGASNPSDRTLADICREFDVNEEWLRTGSGEMFVEKTRDEQIASFFGDVLAEEPDFRRRFLSVLSRLDESEWIMLENMAKTLADEMKKEKADQ